MTINDHDHCDTQMRRTLRAAYFLIGIFAASLAVAQGADFSKAGFKINKVTDNVYLLEGPVSNIGVYSGAEGIVAVDDGLQPMGQMVRSALKSISAKPIRYVINTHEHADHTGGNAEFTKDALIIAHDNVRNRMETGGASGSGGALRFDTPPGTRESLPVLTFDKSLTLHLIGEQIRVVHFPNAHTIGDSMVFFQKSNVVETGDIFSNGVFPFIDRLGGGSVDGVIAACETLVAQSPKDIKVIPGHGPVSSLDDVRVYVAMLKATREVIAQQVKADKTLNQMKAAKVLEPWQKWSGSFVDTNAFIDILFDDLTRKEGARQ